MTEAEKVRQAVIRKDVDAAMRAASMASIQRPKMQRSPVKVIGNALEPPSMLAAGVSAIRPAAPAPVAAAAARPTNPAHSDGRGTWTEEVAAEKREEKMEAPAARQPESAAEPVPLVASGAAASEPEREPAPVPEHEHEPEHEPPELPDPDEALLMAYRAGMQAGRLGASASLPALPPLRTIVTSDLEIRWAADAVSLLGSRPARLVGAGEAPSRRRAVPPSAVASAASVEAELRELSSLLPASMAHLAEGNAPLQLQPRERRVRSLPQLLALPSKPAYVLSQASLATQSFAGQGAYRSRTGSAVGLSPGALRPSGRAASPPPPRPAPEQPLPLGKGDRGTVEKHMAYGRKAVRRDRPSIALVSSAAPMQRPAFSARPLSPARPWSEESTQELPRESERDLPAVGIATTITYSTPKE